MATPLIQTAPADASELETGGGGAPEKMRGSPSNNSAPSASASAASVSRWSYGFPDRGDRSAAPSTRTASRPRLLAGLCDGNEAGVLGSTVHVVEACGSDSSHPHKKIGELVRHLWPGDTHSHSLCRTLRFLSDTTKQGFLLRPTKRGILVRADFARALVEPSRVVFLSARGSFFESFKDELLEFVRGSCKGSFNDQYAFSSFVVESIVCAAVTMQTLRFQVLNPVAENILAGIRFQSPNSILQLYPVKLALSTFVEQVRPLVQGLNGALLEPGNEAALVGARLTGNESMLMGARFLRKMSVGSDEGADAPPADSQRPLSGFPDQLPGGLEDCLLNWAQNAEEVLADAQETINAIEDTMRFLEASMSCTRNRLLGFELATMIATVAMGFGALVSGIFGMNLTNGMETQQGMFNQVVMMITCVGILITVVSVAFIFWSQRHYQNHTAEFGNNRFFRSIVDDDYVLSLCSRSDDADSSPKVELDKVMSELRAPAMPLSDTHCERSCRRRPTRTATLRGLEIQRDSF